MLKPQKHVTLAKATFVVAEEGSLNR